MGAGQLAKGWITTLALRPGRLTYDRLGIVTQVTKNKDGELSWEPAGSETAAAAPEPAEAKVVTIDGRLLRQMRHARGLSREALAWTAGLGITTLTRLEAQASPRCRHQTIQRLAAVLGENPGAMTASPLSDDRP